MSDLAPFVAAAIRDKVFLDMMEEMKEEKSKAQRLALTGPNRSVSFATGKFDENGRRSSAIGRWRVHVKNLEPCSIKSLGEVEVWLSNHLLMKFDLFSTRFLIRKDDDQNGISDRRYVPDGTRSVPSNSLNVCFFFRSEPVDWIMGSIFLDDGETTTTTSGEDGQFIPDRFQGGQQDYRLGDLTSAVSPQVKVSFSDIGFIVDRNYHGLKAHYDALPKALRNKEHLVMEAIRQRCKDTTIPKSLCLHENWPLIKDPTTTTNCGDLSSSCWNDENAEWRFLVQIYKFLILGEVNGADPDGSRFKSIMGKLQKPMSYLWHKPNFGDRSCQLFRRIFKNATEELNRVQVNENNIIPPTKASVEKIQEILTRLATKEISADHLFFPLLMIS